MTSNRAQNWLKIALIYLVLIAVIGIIMRVKLAFIFPVFNFQYILHAHSHVAMLGWVYSALFIAFLYSYLPDKGFTDKKYIRIFWLTQASIIGMLFAFSAQGYAAVSITFSTLHILLSYWFVLTFLKDIRKGTGLNEKHKYSLKFIKAGLFFLFISTFGPWSLAVLASQKMTGSEIYTQAIYFYLHFLYNGFFTFSLLGLWIKSFEDSGYAINHKLLNVSFLTLIISTVPAYFLSLLGFNIPEYLKVIGLISGIAEFLAFLVLINLIIQKRNSVLSFLRKPVKMLTYVSLISLFLKSSMQLLSAFPPLTQIVFGFRDIVIGYIHLVMLGFVTCGLLAWFGYKNIIDLNSAISRTSILLFLFGFFTSEILLFLQLLVSFINLSSIPYHMLLLITSLLMLTGFIILWFKQLKYTSQIK